ncbi:Zn-dependent exopeptidase [Pluteus cervinus]|uniref:Zn-dependent exopeptidase n=1 Tax=Pluteus cervinus TaxID=181527 RepID=A0ACD3AE80_9AGAR|nr:Zn-dependent exopeptidase [Pluteus cervinus]
MRAEAATALSLLVTPFQEFLLDQSSCLKQGFYGNYRDGASMKSVFISDQSCYRSTVMLLDFGVMAPSPEAGKQLVWIEEKAVDPSLNPSPFNSTLFDFIGRLGQPSSTSDLQWNQEVVFTTSHEAPPQLLFQSFTAALLAVDHTTARTIDQRLPRFWKSTILPQEPVQYMPVPGAAVDRVGKILTGLTKNEEIAFIVNNISSYQMRNDIRFLTGEDSRSGILSRHSFSDGARTAAKWLKTRFETTGATCELQDFLEGFAPNVVCRYNPVKESDSLVLISAHYDSRGSFGSTRAPGGNDDGSGTTALLSIARTIGRLGVKFHHNVELVAFAGEEQGLLGSRAYSAKLREQNADIILMIQADMLAYHKPGEPPQLGLPESIGTPEVSDLVGNISTIYTPELKIGTTRACCSDHQSFHQQGFPATQVFERADWIADPMYHNSGDLSDREGYDFDQLKAIAQVQFATLLHAAGYELSR